MAATKRRAPVRREQCEPKVHRTVYQRIARNTEGYAPGSVPPDAEVITTSSPEVTAPIRALVATHHGDDRSLVEREGAAHVLGKSAYWLMIAMSLTCAAMIVATYYRDIASIPGWQERAVAVMSTIVSTNWLAVTGRVLWHDPWLAVGALLGLWLNIRVASHLDTGVLGVLAPLARAAAGGPGPAATGLAASRVSPSRVRRRRCATRSRCSRWPIAARFASRSESRSGQAGAGAGRHSADAVRFRR